MKIILTLLASFLYQHLYAQEGNFARKEIEIFVITKNISNKNIFYKMQALQNFVYENDLIRWNYSITTNNKWTSSSLPLNAPVDIITNDDQTGYSGAAWTWRGFDFVSGSEEHNPEQPDFAYGIYKFTCYEVDVLNNVIELPGWFYIDYRDNYFPADDPPGPDLNPYSTAGVDNDIFIKYDVGEGKFFLHTTSFTQILQSVHGQISSLKVR